MLSGQQSQLEQYLRLRKPMQEERAGFTGMIQHRFLNEADADNLAIWLKQQANLQALGIEKAKATKETDPEGKTVYIVRLTKEQQAIILPEKDKAFLQVSGPYQRTAFHTAALEANELAFIALLTEVSSAAINAALTMQDTEGWTPLQLAAHYQKECGWLALLEKASPAKIDATLVMRNMHSWTPLHNAARYQNERGWIALLEKASPAVIDAALVMQEKEGRTPLDIAARYQSKHGYLALLEKTSSAVIDAALVMQDKDGWNPLHTAARHQSEHGWIALIEKASPAVIDAALVMQDAYNWTPLHLAARHQSEHGWTALLEKASPAVIDTALIMQNKDGWTPLHLAARHQSERGWIALLEKAAPAVIDAALIMKNKDGWTLLHMAARYQSERGWIALLEKASPAVIDAALIMQNKDGWSPLHTAAHTQSERGLIALLEKAAPAVIDTVFVMQDKDGWTALRFAARYQSERVFLVMLEKISPAVLSKCFELEGEGLWAEVFASQSPATCARLLKTVSAAGLAGIKSSKFNQHKCISYLLHETSWQDPALIKLCLDTLPQKLLTALLEHWREGRVLSAELKKHLTQTLQQVDKSKLTRLEADFLQFANTSSDAPTLTAQQVFSRGLTSWNEYRSLRMVQQQLPGMKEALDLLKTTDLVLTGSKINFTPSPPSARDLACDLIKRDIAQDKILFKMIATKDWPEFLSQIVDYNTRPATMRDPDGKKEATHKFRHMTGKIEDFVPNQAPHPRRQHTHTKKLATTLMARNMSTMVFGERQTDKPLVGLMFNRELCKLKALLAKDSATYFRYWVGKRKDVEQYATQMQAISFTDKDKFIERVNQQSHRTNEVLAELSVASMLSIMIAGDTPEARKIARERQKELQTKLNVTLPIVFYDNVTRDITPYTTKQIQLDEAGISETEELHAKMKLIALKNKIISKNNWYVFSPFAFFSAQPLLPKTASNILTLIDGAQQQADAGQYPWKSTMQTIEQLLAGVLADRSIHSIFRFQDTIDFYQDARSGIT